MTGPARPYPRHVRIAAQLEREIATWLVTEADAPWDTLATVTRLETSRDLRHADVYVLLHEDDESRRGELLDYLKGQAGMLRGRLGRTLHVKRVPALNFRYDDAYADAARVEAILTHLNDIERDA